MNKKIFKNEYAFRNFLSMLILAAFLIFELLYLNIIPNSFLGRESNSSLISISQPVVASDSELSILHDDESDEDVKLELLDNTTQYIDSEKKNFNGNYTIATVSESYFDNTLFIGDSRMVGFSIYRQIPGATYYCYQSADSFTILEKEYELQPYGMISLYNLLSIKRFDKIYVSLGINNVGAGLDSHWKHYKRLLDTIKSLQPSAIIYLLGNLHVTSQLINDNLNLNNENINYINKFISEFEDKRQVFYLDPNVMYDDEFGNMDSELSYDHAHIYVKHYDRYLYFLLTHAVVYDE